MGGHSDNFDIFEFVNVSRPTAQVYRDQARGEQGARGRRTRYFIPKMLAAVAVGMLLGILLMKYRQHAVEAVLSVNGTVFSRDQFFGRLQTAAADQVIRKYIEEELALQFAWHRGVRPTEAEVEARYAEAMKHPEIAADVAAHYVSPDDYKRALRVQMAQAGVLGHGVTITDGEVRNEYLKNIDPNNLHARYYTPEIARVAVVVTRKEDVARLVGEELRVGVPFGTAAQQHSQDASAARGGLFPPFERGRSPFSRVPGLEKVIFGMRPGDILGPREFGQQWWIIHCLDLKPARTALFESVQADCRTRLEMQKGLARDNSKLQAELRRFQSTAQIQIFWPQFAHLVPR